MTIKIRLHGDKATVRFSNEKERDYFAHLVVQAKNAVTSPPNPGFSIKDENGDEVKLKT